jgi:hypothetical protein
MEMRLNINKKFKRNNKTTDAIELSLTVLKLQNLTNILLMPIIYDFFFIKFEFNKSVN